MGFSLLDIITNKEHLKLYIYVITSFLILQEILNLILLVTPYHLLTHLRNNALTYLRRRVKLIFKFLC